MDVNCINQGIDIQGVESYSIDQKIFDLTEIAKGVLTNLGDQCIIQLDPERVTNAVSFIIDQIEAIQSAEKLYLMMTRGENNESIKEVLMGYKNRPEGFIANTVLTSFLTDAAESGNVEIMDFIFSVFADRLDLDESDASEVIQGYIDAGEEEKAIERLDLLDGEYALYELRNLQQYAQEAEMNELAEIIRLRIEGSDMKDAL